jgi:glycyl-tRNA synthetase beta chain
VVQILAGEPDMPALIDMNLHSAQTYEQVNGLELDVDDICRSLRDLFGQRMGAYLQERGIRYDLIDAALSGGSVYSTPVYGVARRAETLQSLVCDPDFVPTLRAAERVANILRSAKQGPQEASIPGKEGAHGVRGRSVERAVSVLESEARRVDRSLLQAPAERRLFDTASSLLPDIARRAADYDYENLYRALSPLRPVVDTFFDEVLVMVESAEVRANRLSLLAFVDALYQTLADFTRVVLREA